MRGIAGALLRVNRLVGSATTQSSAGRDMGLLSKSDSHSHWDSFLDSVGDTPLLANKPFHERS